jgi:hypothetical protein
MRRGLGDQYAKTGKGAGYMRCGHVEKRAREDVEFGLVALAHDVEVLGRTGHGLGCDREETADGYEGKWLCWGDGREGGGGGRWARH